MRDLYSNDVQTAAELAGRDDHEPDVPCPSEYRDDYPPSPWESRGLRPRPGVPINTTDWQPIPPADTPRAA